MIKHSLKTTVFVVPTGVKVSEGARERAWNGRRNVSTSDATYKGLSLRYFKQTSLKYLRFFCRVLHACEYFKLFCVLADECKALPCPICFINSCFETTKRRSQSDGTAVARPLAFHSNHPRTFTDSFGKCYAPNMLSWNLFFILYMMLMFKSFCCQRVGKIKVSAFIFGRCLHRWKFSRDQFSVFSF